MMSLNWEGKSRSAVHRRGMNRDVNEDWRKFPRRESHRGGDVESLAARSGRVAQEKILKGNNGNAALGLIILIAKHSY